MRGFLGVARAAAGCAFVTVVTSRDFQVCTEVWAKSLQATGMRAKVLVLALPGTVDAAPLQEAGAEILQVPPVENPGGEHLLFEAFRENFAILRVWELDGSAPWAPGLAFERVVYMDADTLVVGAIEELCDAQTDFAANADVGTEQFNAGVMALRPDGAVFRSLLARARDVASPTGGVQPLLRAFFTQAAPLGAGHNVNARLYGTDAYPVLVTGLPQAAPCKIRYTCSS